MKVPEKPLSYLESLQDRYEVWKKVNVYFIPGIDTNTGEKMYFYALASKSLHEAMVKSLEAGDIPDFAVIVEKGRGEPTAEVKEKIKRNYGFDHDFHAAEEGRRYR